MDTKKDLLDIITVKNEAKTVLYYFYYFNHIEIFSRMNNVLKKERIIKFDLDKDEYAVINREGRLFYFKFKGSEFLIIGNNFSKKSFVYKYSAKGWHYFSKIDFIPFKVFKSNGENYFIGGQYAIGKNYYKGRLTMKSLVSIENNSTDEFYKKIKPFYSISFLTENNKIRKIYLLDREYNFIQYGSDFQIKEKDKDKRGYAMSLIANKWIVKSAFTFSNDELSFFKINEFETTPKYSEKIHGSVIFLRDGFWNDKQGVWCYIKIAVNNYYTYKLQFWSKNAF